MDLSGASPQSYLRFMRGRVRLSLLAGTASLLAASGFTARADGAGPVSNAVAVKADSPAAAVNPGVAAGQSTDPKLIALHAAQRAAEIRQRFRDLADPKPSIRADARSWMLAMERPDLLVLKDVVKRSRPIHRSQVAVLREIVMHVYLRSDPYVREEEDRGFLGVMFGAEFEVSEPESGGVEIRRRMPGFCAYRYLEDGDVIRAVVGNPTREVHIPGDVIMEVKRYAAGDTVVLEVLRDGRVIRVPIILDPRPKSIGNEAMTADFLGRRQTEAENYWDEHFDALVKDKMG